VARIERGLKTYTLNEADLGAITREVLSAMEYQLERFRVTLRGLSPRARYPVRVDPDATKQAMINLLVNAIKYSPQPRNRKLTIALSKRNGWIQWSIRDHGLGIPAEVIPHIFEPFYRDPSIREKVGGVGLGLPLVKHIMEAHGGIVRCSSNEGKGSAFWLEFPSRGRTR
jgi:signal transduction histidine kinase